ncbi:hypothetical protein DACRYDRAFT_116494 [Dacryopinax primogenitus]|uniref:C-CAP/cofactor C-like domain-containing protein n=1 Tax=Dacryopinax primogenitus (strain DJM 731) TaxID=1858805 RepID=M5FXS6_DACPD|nr:uncharacterized protein DACRYDRAFT_116494 [Dacryopinax primogenitus]EJU01304.1 hypothetical protein DACRYDRAFT_116494 [Dacryopinax primogenitus]
MAEQRILGEQFVAQFKERRSNIESLAESGKGTPGEYESQVTALRAELTASMDLLTGYNQRQLDTQLKALEQKVREAKASAKPQGKFSFKRMKPVAKPVVASSSSSTSAPATSSLVPSTSSGHTIFSLSNSCITFASLNSEPGADLLLSSLDHCLVNLIPASADLPPPTPVLGSIHARALRHTVLLLPVIPGSVFLEGCTECLVVVGCHQLRIHASENTTVLLQVNSVPIIEHCRGISVGEYPAVLRALVLQDSGTTFDSKHAEMQDFNWLQGGQSPNWNRISAESATSWDDRVRRLMQQAQGPIADTVLGL